MLCIRNEQMAVFERETRRRFEEEMVAHSHAFSPKLCSVLGDEQLRHTLRQTMARANSYGFTNRGPVRLYIELMFLRGSHFDTDPQYPSLGRLLRAPDDQMWRAERIHEECGDYLERVSGPGAINVRKALEALADFARSPPVLSSRHFVSVVLREMTRIFPQKAAYVGEARLTALVEEGRAEAAKHGFIAPQEEALLVVLMFAFGHGCARDPLYPWISRTLEDPRIRNPAARAVRLEHKAMTWLHHVMVEPGEGGEG